MATVWTDATLIAGTTEIKAVHFSELRIATANEKIRRSLGVTTFTDPTLIPGATEIKKIHTDELRSAVSYSSFAPTDSILTTGVSVIKKVHVEELRTKINVLESHAVVGGVSDCNAGCTGMCVSCSGTCIGGCTSCTSCTSCSSCSGSCSGSCVSECEVNCNSNCSFYCAVATCTSCFPAGTRVLMEDRTERIIEQIRIGDSVIGMDGRAHKVLGLYPTYLGANRALFKFTDDNLAWSGEHPLWIKTPEEEYWGVHDYNGYIREVNAALSPDMPEHCRDYGLKKKNPLIIAETVEYAHIDGWKKKEVVIDRNAKSDLPLYDLIIDGPGTMICNGYVVSAFVSDDKYDFSTFKWKGLK